MKKLQPSPWLIALILVAFGVTQVELYVLYRHFQTEPGETKLQTTQTKKVPEAETPVIKQSSQDRFRSEGTSIVRERPDGTRKTIISSLEEKMELDIAGEVDVIAHSEENSVIIAATCWEGNAPRTLYKLDAEQKTLTKMNSTAPCRVEVARKGWGRFSDYLIYPGPQGDRFIWVDLIRDVSTPVAILPAPYTYIQTLDESGYSDFVLGEVRWDDGFIAEVFDGGIPLDLFDVRLPVMEKRIYRPRG